MKTLKMIVKMLSGCLLFFLMMLCECCVNNLQTKDGVVSETSGDRLWKAVSPAELIGYGAGTIGGTGGNSVTVSTYKNFTACTSDSAARVVNISGTISGSGMLKIGSNKTIQGIGADAAISGFGLNISAQTNIIIQNIAFSNADDDSINIEESSSKIWITHCNFTKGYDGLIDIKMKSTNITISWNKFYNHNKTSLLGHSDDYDDTGYLKVTYHHNWFNGTSQRHPRVRWGNVVHVFNNLYENNYVYSVAATCNAGVLVEGCCFNGVRRPFSLSEGGSPQGHLNERNNIFVNCGTIVTNGSVSDPPYSYPIDNASDIPSIVKTYAGVTRIHNAL